MEQTEIWDGGPEDDHRFDSEDDQQVPGVIFIVSIWLLPCFYQYFRGS